MNRIYNAELLLTSIDVNDMFSIFPSVRPDADQLTKIPFFEDVGAMALHFLDTLFQKVLFVYTIVC